MTSGNGAEAGAVQNLWDTTEAWAAAGEAERIAGVVDSLALQREAARERLRTLDHDLGHAMRVLALTPGRRFVAQLLRLYPQVVRAGTTENTSPRRLASLIAEAQPLEDALYVLSESGTGPEQELATCLFHELLLRGENPDELRRHFAVEYRVPSWSALAWLPGRLAEMEYGASFPTRSYRGGAGSRSPGMSSPVPVDAAARRAGAAHHSREVTTVRLAEAIGGAPSQGDWGAHEAQVFVMGRRIAPEDLPGVLTALPLRCLEGLGERDRFEIETCSVDEVWEMLFATAADGGVYAPGVYGAYGRLAAWGSLAGLCGAGDGADAAEVERLALACTWFRFAADSEWFHNEINDYGIAALGPDGRRVAVLAATDTD